MKPPSRKLIGGRLLDEAYERMRKDVKAKLSGGMHTLSMDGWTTPMNVPLVGIAIGEMLIEIVEERESHTGKKLAEILQKAIPAIEKEMEVEIVGLVTDGASNFSKGGVSPTLQRMQKAKRTIGGAYHLWHELLHGAPDAQPGEPIL